VKGTGLGLLTPTENSTERRACPSFRSPAIIRKSVRSPGWVITAAVAVLVMGCACASYRKKIHLWHQSEQRTSWTHHIYLEEGWLKLDRHKWADAAASDEDVATELQWAQDEKPGWWQTPPLHFDPAATYTDLGLFAIQAACMEFLVRGGAPRWTAESLGWYHREVYGLRLWVVDGILWLCCCMSFGRAVRHNCRARKGLCVNCGYDLQGSKHSSLCPECGAAAEDSNTPAGSVEHAGE